MPNRIGFKELVEKAESEIETVSAGEAMERLKDPNVVIVDLRDVREVAREGKIPNAFHMPRGMLEFWIDPESPYYKSIFSTDKKFIFYCNKGWRSALATATAKMMGLENVCHIAGGYAAWVEANGPTEEVPVK